MGLTFIYLWLISLCSCQKELIEYEKGDVKICIEQGEHWLHDFPLFLGINKKNPPQIAIWLEDTQGNYLSTVYVTHKSPLNLGKHREETDEKKLYLIGVIHVELNTMMDFICQQRKSH